MLKCPLMEIKFLIAVSLSIPKTGLDQSEAVKIVLEFLTLGYTEQKFNESKEPVKNHLKYLWPVTLIYLCTFQRGCAHHCSHRYSHPLNKERDEGQNTFVHSVLVYKIQGQISVDFSKKIISAKKLVPYRQPELSKVQKNLYLTGSPKCQNLYLIGSLF